MPLVSENTLLSNAEKGNYAVPGLFPFDMDYIKIIIEAAEEENSPLIILQGPEFIKDFSAPVFSSALLTAANNAKVPVCLSVDHAFKIDENIFNDVMMCIHNGWKSIMIDGSLLSYEENVKITKEIVRLCHAAGIACCGALGEVRRFFPGVRNYKEPFKDDFVVPDEIMTDPEQAKNFVDVTGVDSLAISIGQYVRSLWEEEKLPVKRTARLDLDRLKAIRETTSAHLILHGSSHVNEEDLKESIKCGISEIKVASEYGVIWATAVRDILVRDKNLMFPIDIQKPALQKVKEMMMGYMRVFNSSGKAGY
ncbi:MAG: class II fructose-bisphosphate aldolase [Chloroflexi bacterium]|nr:class II fructose-bisphosphate aldolase [Chloroflexota bacterium]